MTQTTSLVEVRPSALTLALTVARAFLISCAIASGTVGALSLMVMLVLRSDALQPPATRDQIDLVLLFSASALLIGGGATWFITAYLRALLRFCVHRDLLVHIAHNPQSIPIAPQRRMGLDRFEAPWPLRKGTLHAAILTTVVCLAPLPAWLMTRGATVIYPVTFVGSAIAAPMAAFAWWWQFSASSASESAPEHPYGSPERIAEAEAATQRAADRQSGPAEPHWLLASDGAGRGSKQAGCGLLMLAGLVGLIVQGQIDRLCADAEVCAAAGWLVPVLQGAVGLACVGVIVVLGAFLNFVRLSFVQLAQVRRSLASAHPAESRPPESDLLLALHRPSPWTWLCLVLALPTAALVWLLFVAAVPGQQGNPILASSPLTALAVIAGVLALGLVILQTLAVRWRFLTAASIRATWPIVEPERFARPEHALGAAGRQRRSSAG